MPPVRYLRRVKALLRHGGLLVMLAGHASYACTDSPLTVMLQGDDIASIAKAITDAGGTVTHQLPIVNAIGATLLRPQLDRVTDTTTGITRVIDDLAWEPDTPLLTQDGCGLVGSIELHWSRSEATWELFNKGDEALTLDRLTLELNDGIPALLTAAVDERPLELQQTTTPEGGRQLALQQTIGAGEYLRISLTFAIPPDNQDTLRKAISLRASAGADCETRLPPRYDDYARDSYFAEVSGAAKLHSHGITGKGVTVAVLDSGLWEDNSELALNTHGEHRVIARFDAIKGTEVDVAFDESGHGTHMTSVLARSAPVTRPGATNPSYRGIAPDTSIVVVKAFGESGEAGFLDLIRGVQWIVDNRERFNIKVLNLSFAARPRWPYWEDPVNQALMRAWQAGIFIAAAAGNEGPEPMTVGSPGNLPYLMTVGAFTDSWTENTRDDDYIPDFSSRGPTPTGHIKPDLVAPGGHMAGYVRPGSTLEKQFPEYVLGTGEFVMTGSSQATAVVSGLAALMLQLEPELSNNNLKCMLITSAEPAISEDGRLAYSPFTQGEGRASVLRAITIGDKSCEQNLLNLEEDITGRDHYQGPAVFSDQAPPSLPGAETLVAEPPTQEGPVPGLRWGIREHLERLDSQPPTYPINWPLRFEVEQERMRKVAEQTP